MFANPVWTPVFLVLGLALLFVGARKINNEGVEGYLKRVFAEISFLERRKRAGFFLEATADESGAFRIVVPESPVNYFLRNNVAEVKCTLGVVFLVIAALV